MVINIDEGPIALVKKVFSSKEFKAFREGWLAFSKGEKPTNNPYTTRYELAGAWMKGYNKAELDTKTIDLSGPTRIQSVREKKSKRNPSRFIQTYKDGTASCRVCDKMFYKPKAFKKAIAHIKHAHASKTEAIKTKKNNKEDLDKYIEVLRPLGSPVPPGNEYLDDYSFACKICKRELPSWMTMDDVRDHVQKHLKGTKK